MKLHLTSARRRLHRALEAVDCRHELGGRHAGAHLELHRDEDLARPLLQRQHVEHALDVRIVGRAPREHRVQRRIGGLAHEQALDLARQQARDADQHEADRERAGAVPARVAGPRREHERGEREPQADHRRGVLAEHDHQIAVLGRAQVREERGRAPPRVDLPHVAEPRPALERERQQQDHERQRDALDRARRAQLRDALVDREHAAAEEQQQRDDERVEVQRAAVAERVRRVGGAPGLAHAAQQEQLVAAVRARVQRLREHRARAADRRRDALGHRDQHVDDERFDDLAGGLAVGHAAPT